MRVGYEYLLPGFQDTGVERTIRNLLTALVRLAPETDFTVFSRGSIERNLLDSPNVRQRRSRMANCGRPARILWQQLVGPTSCRREDLDVYHATGYVVSPRFGIPTVVSVYDTISLERERLTTSLNAIHYRWAVPMGIRSAKQIVVPSEYVRSRLMEITKSAGDNIHVVPLGVSTSFVRLERDEANRRLRPLFQTIPESFLLFVGNIERKKNLRTLISAFSRSRCRRKMNLKLVLAGKAGNALSIVKRTIREERLDEDVILTGYVDEETLVALYNAASLVVYPSEMEGFGLPPLEAMACGTPVVASRAGSIPEVVGDAALLVDPGNVDGLAESLDGVLHSHEIHASLVARGLRRSKAYNWERAAERTLEIYREVCTSG